MSLRSRNFRPQDLISADKDTHKKNGVSRRSILPATILRKGKSRLFILISVCMSFLFLRGHAYKALSQLVTWYFEAHCESEDVALWRGTHLVEKFSKFDATTEIDLVVSHCDLPIDWIFKWAAPLEFRNITIFSKCGKPVVGAPKAAKIVRLENVGRCDHTYAHFMANYHIDSKTRSDFVLFLKDNDNAHRRPISRHKKLDEMVPLAKEFGFACHEETNWVWSEASPLHPICQISYYHDWAGLRQYSVKKYSRLRRDENSDFQSQAGDTLGEYAEGMGIVPQGFSGSLKSPDKGEGIVSNQDVIVPVCYGGNFMVHSQQILNHDPAFWERIASSLSRSNNIAEGHFAERLWGTMLAKPLQQDVADRVLRQARHGVCNLGKDRVGALSK